VKVDTGPVRDPAERPDSGFLGVRYATRCTFAHLLEIRMSMHIHIHTHTHMMHMTLETDKKCYYGLVPPGLLLAPCLRSRLLLE
jgi:hypothetical protein